MNSSVQGRVVSLHLHPATAGRPLTQVETVEAVAHVGLVGDRRYADRKRDPGARPPKRQVTLIEREQIAEQAAVAGIESLPPGAVRSNIETEGIVLREHLGKTVRVGRALLLFVEDRTPCSKMDDLHPGLQAAMKEGRQGVIARVIESGLIRCGDPIRLEPQPNPVSA